jgi:hypothetical protein
MIAKQTIHLEKSCVVYHFLRSFSVSVSTLLSIALLSSVSFGDNLPLVTGYKANTLSQDDIECISQISERIQSKSGHPVFLKSQPDFTGALGSVEVFFSPFESSKRIIKLQSVKCFYGKNYQPETGEYKSGNWVTREQPAAPTNATFTALLSLPEFPFSSQLPPTVPYVVVHVLTPMSASDLVALFDTVCESMDVRNEQGLRKFGFCLLKEETFQTNKSLVFSSETGGVGGGVIRRIYLERHDSHWVILRVQNMILD